MNDDLKREITALVVTSPFLCMFLLVFAVYMWPSSFTGEAVEAVQRGAALMGAGAFVLVYHARVRMVWRGR